MSEATIAIEGIRQSAKARGKADAAKREATEKLRGHCREAQAAGVSISQIAREAGLSRQGVYDLLSAPSSR